MRVLCVIVRAFVGCRIAFLLLCGSVALAELPEPNTPAANTKSWTVDAIIAAVAWRETAIADCSLTFTETISLSDVQKPLREIIRKEVEYYQRSNVIAFTASEHYLTRTPPRNNQWRESWDGRISRGLYTVSQEGMEGEVRASIVERMPPLLEQSACLRALNLSPKESLSARLSRLIEVHEAPTEVAVGEEDGELVVTFSLLRPGKGPPNLWEFKFLPNKDFVMKEARRWSYSSMSFEIPTSEAYVNVTDFEQIDGIWMPMKIVEERTFYHGGRFDALNRIESEVTFFSKAKPTDEQMTIEFPPSTLVADSVNNEAYTIQAGGSKEHVPFYDSNTGEIMQPPSGTNNSGDE